MIPQALGQGIGGEAGVLPESDWRNRAACRDRPPGLWFPSTPNVKTIPDAKEICSRCPVKAECATFAEENPDLACYGIWAGITEWERFSRRKYPSGCTRVDRPLPTQVEAKERKEKAQRWTAEGMHAGLIAEVLGVSRRTVARYLGRA